MTRVPQAHLLMDRGVRHPSKQSGRQAQRHHTGDLCAKPMKRSMVSMVWESRAISCQHSTLGKPLNLSPGPTLHSDYILVL